MYAVVSLSPPRILALSRKSSEFVYSRKAIIDSRMVPWHGVSKTESTPPVIERIAWATAMVNTVSSVRRKYLLKSGKGVMLMGEHSKTEPAISPAITPSAALLRHLVIDMPDKNLPATQGDCLIGVTISSRIVTALSKPGTLKCFFNPPIDILRNRAQFSRFDGAHKCLTRLAVLFGDSAPGP